MAPLPHLVGSAFAVLLFLSPAEAQFSYVTNNGTITISGYSSPGTSNRIDIPDHIEGLPVTAIGVSAFEGDSAVMRVTIPNTVTSIKSSAFSSCFNLIEVSVGSGVSLIEHSAFAYCPSLAGVYFTGNAPTLDSLGYVPMLEPFYSDDNATAFYLTNTIGWAPKLGAIGTAPWNPVIQTTSVGFGVRFNTFGFFVNGSFVVEACTNLMSPVWEQRQAVNLRNGLFYFTDPEWTNFPARFYRLRSP